jgi:phosphatidylethanolamine-binding protein (PEBP) family uncharacterized protein
MRVWARTMQHLPSPARFLRLAFLVNLLVSVVPATPAAAFRLWSPVVGEDGKLPVEFTGDGAGISPPLAWTNAPAGTRSLAVSMHHLDPEGRTKWYWTVYNIPASTDHLETNSRGVGTLGNNGVTRREGYAPPHSKGPGAKTYVITLYALSAPLEMAEPPARVSRDVLLAAMEGKILGSVDLRVNHTRPAGAVEQADRPPRREPGGGGRGNPRGPGGPEPRPQ